MKVLSAEEESIDAGIYPVCQVFIVTAYCRSLYRVLSPFCYLPREHKSLLSSVSVYVILWRTIPSLHVPEVQRCGVLSPLVVSVLAALA